MRGKSKIKFERVEKKLLEHNYTLNDRKEFYYLDDNVEIICNKHGKFETTINRLLHKTFGDCPDCTKDKTQYNRTNTFLKRYGTTTPFKNKDIINKIKQTNLERYGNVCSLHGTNQDKIDKIFFNKYGQKHYLGSKDCLDKSRKYYLENYGVENASQIKEIKSKQVKKWKEKEKEIVNKIKETKENKYGNENYNNNELREKTCLEKYGYKTILQNKEIREKRNKIIYDNLLKERNEKSEILNTINEIEKDYLYKIAFVSITKDIYNNDIVNYIIKCKECGNIFSWNKFIYTNTRTKQRPVCPDCQGNFSLIEKDLLFFIKSIYKDEIIENDRQVIKPYELYIYLPDKKIAIEMDGIYWHQYQSNKYELCKKQNVRLIRIFDIEWENKKEIVKSILNNLLNSTNITKIYARKCEIKEITNDVYKQFCEGNHIQGFAPASVRIGLFYNNELIQIMSFSKSRLNKNYQWEMIRECSKLNYNIIGGKSKLLKYFERKYKPESIISYCDKRLFNGISYIKLGFKLNHESKPNYWWAKTKLESRLKYQKHKLKDMKFYDEKLTETEIMKLNGYKKIYDCGNFVFSKR